MNPQCEEINFTSRFVIFNYINIILDTGNLVTKSLMREFFDVQIRDNLKEYALVNKVENIEDRLEILRKDVSRVSF